MTDWTNPPTQEVGHLTSVADLNTYLRDNLKNIYERITGPFPFNLDPRNFHNVTQTLVATTTYYGRTRGVGAVDSVAFRVQTAAGNVSVALYDNTGSGRSARPNTRLQTSGSVACPAAGSADVALGGTTTITAPCAHWLALSCSGAPVLLGTGSNPVDSSLGSGLSYREAVHPAPATATATPTAIIAPPMLIGA